MAVSVRTGDGPLRPSHLPIMKSPLRILVPAFLLLVGIIVRAEPSPGPPRRWPMPTCS